MPNLVRLIRVSDSEGGLGRSPDEAHRRYPRRINFCDGWHRQVGQIRGFVPMGRQKAYLITGATGFIGSNLLRKLISQNNVTHILLQAQSDVWRIKDILYDTTVHLSDLSDIDTLTRILDNIQPDIIYHLATYGAYSSQDNPDLCVRTNVMGTWNLLKAASHVDYEMFVNTGSSSEYGFKKSPMKEQDSLEPASYYAVTKCAQTLLCSYFAKHNNKPIVTLRPFSVYGPYEDKGRFVPVLLKALYFHTGMNLVSPNIARDWIYVDDAVDAYLLVSTLGTHTGEVFNVGTGVQTTIKEVVELAVSITGKRTTLNWNKMKHRIWDTDYWIADTSKTAGILKWKPTVDLSQGLLLTWKWLKDNLHHYV